MTHVGDVSWRGQEKTLTLARSWLEHTCAATRERRWEVLNQWRRALSTMLPTARQKAGRDYNTVDMSERQLREVYLPPFKAAVDEGVATLMSAFNTISGVPASANDFTLNQVLRREWNFRGFVVSDWGSVGELMNHGVANDLATAAHKGFLAGVDMDMESNAYFQHLSRAVKAGQVSQSADRRSSTTHSSHQVRAGTL